MLKLTMPYTDEEFFLPAGNYNLGRTADSHIILKHDTVSRAHAHLFHENDSWKIRDLGSTNGTLVNGNLLEGTIELYCESRVQLGGVSLTLTPWDQEDVVPDQICKFPLRPRIRPKESTDGLSRNILEQARQKETFLNLLSTVNTREDFYRSRLPEMLETHGLSGFGLILSFRRNPYVYFSHGTPPANWLEIAGIKNNLFGRDVRLSDDDGWQWISKPMKISGQEMTMYIITTIKRFPSGLPEYLLTRLVHLARFLYLVDRNNEKPDPGVTQKMIPCSATEHVLHLPALDGPVLFPSHVSRRLVEDIRALAKTKAGVILEGETGVGKEIAAAMIHHFSGRKGPFMPVMTSSLPENLVENELFGHMKGAYSGAVSTEKGKFEAADGGTVFLDEVADMPAAVQAKLLRVLENGEVYPVGATSPTRVDVRLVTASNIPFTQLVEEKRLRRDVYYRLKTFSVRIPPLRERRQEILPLFEFFIARTAEKNDKTFRGISPKATRMLLQYAWPGNVRELKNEAERLALIMKNSGVIHGDMLNDEIRAGEFRPPGIPEGDDLKSRVDHLELDMISRALEETGGNRTRAAEKLGLSRKGLFKKMTRLGIE